MNQLTNRHHPEVQGCHFVATILRLCGIVVALGAACLASGCADGTHISSLNEQVAQRAEAIRAEERALNEQRATVSELSRKVSSLEAERAPKVAYLIRVKEGSPTITACILGQADAKGALIAMFGETEAERYAGGFVATVCVFARFHDDYDSVSRQLDVILPALADVSRRLAESKAQLHRAEANLNQLTAAAQAPSLQLEIASLNAALTCERDVGCRLKRMFGGGNT